MHLLVQGTEGGHGETLPAPRGLGAQTLRGHSSLRDNVLRDTEMPRAHPSAGEAFRTGALSAGWPSEPRPRDRWGRRTWGARGRARRRRGRVGRAWSSATGPALCCFAPPSGAEVFHSPRWRTGSTGLATSAFPHGSVDGLGVHGTTRAVVSATGGGCGGRRQRHRTTST